MSGEMSETIFVVNQIGSGCYGFPSEPQIDKYGNWCGYGWFRLSESYMPPPGECWEYRLTRKGDIDTDGDPIGWKIVGIGKDGSVLCEKGNGQRRRYLFGDGANWKPIDDAEQLAKAREVLRDIQKQSCKSGSIRSYVVNSIIDISGVRL